MSDEQMYKLWCSIPTVGNVDEDVIAFGKAVRRAALEEAEKVCDEKQDWYEKDRCIGQATAVGACADEIRALAASDSEGGKSK
jgi:hypothetical protein